MAALLLVPLAVSALAAPAGPEAAAGSEVRTAAGTSVTASVSGSRTPDRHPSAPTRRPNIVMIMADDLSFDLLPFMPTVTRMVSRGASFDRYVVASTLCCPSRATILTGRYPHSTGVLANDGPRGGYDEFRERAERSTFASALDRAGYHTGMIGKHLNRYHVTLRENASPIPPGWDEWYVTGGSGYRQYDYLVNENGVMVRYGTAPEDYGTDVMSRTAQDFIARAARHDSPFLLEIAPFSPHQPATPAPRHAQDFPGLHAPRSPAFNTGNVAAPRWLARRQTLTAQQVAALDVEYRLRAQSAATIDDLVADVRRALADAGVARNTYVVFTSDNGYHTGEHRLPAGKRTAFDSDIRVPLVVTGPGVAPGTRIRALASSTDLAPTFRELGRARTSPLVEGRSLVGWLTGRRPAVWRTGVLVDYLDAKMYLNDPDRQPSRFGAPARYRALRTRNHLWVAYLNGQREHYDLRRDPQQRINTARHLSRAKRAALDRQLRALARCSGAVSCHEADTLRWRSRR